MFVAVLFVLVIETEELELCIHKQNYSLHGGKAKWKSIHKKLWLMILSQVSMSVSFHMYVPPDKFSLNFKSCVYNSKLETGNVFYFLNIYVLQCI